MATYVIDKGDCYHLEKIYEGYKITFTKDNKLQSQEVSDIPKTSETIGYCDEKIPLFNGKYLIRIRDSLIISED